MCFVHNKRIQNLQTAHFTTFHNISQPNFAILLSLGCSLLLAVVMNFTISKFFKILPITQSVYYRLIQGLLSIRLPNTEKFCLGRHALT